MIFFGKFASDFFACEYIECKTKGPSDDEQRNLHIVYRALPMFKYLKIIPALALFYYANMVFGFHSVDVLRRIFRCCCEDCVGEGIALAFLYGISSALFVEAYREFFGPNRGLLGLSLVSGALRGAVGEEHPKETFF